jgi:hypothetical protein
MAIKRRLREIITLSDYYYYYYYSPCFEKVPHLVAVVVLVAERKGIYPGDPLRHSHDCVNVKALQYSS